MLNKAITKYEAIDLDIRIRLAGGKDGYPELSDILNEDKLEDIKVNTDERTLGNKQMLDNMLKIRNKNDNSR